MKKLLLVILTIIFYFSPARVISVMAKNENYLDLTNYTNLPLTPEPEAGDQNPIISYIDKEKSYVSLKHYAEIPLQITENKNQVMQMASAKRFSGGGVVLVDLEQLFDKYCEQYGVNKLLMKKIAQCESGFNLQAVNGPYAGLYQFQASTWVSNRKAMGFNPDPALRFNAEESIKTAAFKISRDGTGAWPVCGK